jgi:hypothetical protein
MKLDVLPSHQTNVPSSPSSSFDSDAFRTRAKSPAASDPDPPAWLNPPPGTHE